MDEQAEKARLIKQMGSRDNNKARAAVQELRYRRWLTDGSLRGADLRRANLSMSDLNEANLRGADLHNAILRGSTFHEANLREANLYEADLQKADLSIASLREANLSEADLHGANLWGANLFATNLHGAMLTDAFVGTTIWSSVDLSTAKGLESVVHSGRSHISITTLERSKGKIPDVFLRGCGVSEDFIQYAMPLFRKSIEFYKCFISYSHKDQSFAQRVHDTLQGKGIRCWKDTHDLLPGNRILDTVNNAILFSDKLLLCCSENSLKESMWVDDEIAKALEKELAFKKAHGIDLDFLIPLNLDGYLFDGYTGGKGSIIRSRLAANFKGWESDNALFEREIEQVIRALRTDGGKETPPSKKL